MMHISVFQVSLRLDIFKDVKDITQYYDVVILACTADAYRPILQQLSKSTLKRIKQIILVSPTLGSHMLVKQILTDVHCEGGDFVFHLSRRYPNI